MRRLLIPIATLSILVAACSRPSDDAPSVAAPIVTAAPAASVPSGGSVVQVVNRVLPAVVNVTTDVFRPDATGGGGQAQGVGTGFIVRPDGVIVTNCHVVEGGSRITVSTSADDPEQYPARVIGGDCLHDVAVLKVQAEDLPTVPLGDSQTLQLGQEVVALGYALALEGGPSVTTGIVSSLDRTIRVQDPGCDACPTQGGVPVRTYADVVQTDAAINHGNSGGPLVDMQGRVVGINSAGNDAAENIGFAIAIDSVEPTIVDAIRDPLAAEAYLGVTTTAITPELTFQFQVPVEEGAFVLGTATDGPASGAGIDEGDVIVSVAGEAVTSPAALGEILDGLRPGEQVEVRLVGPAGEARTIEVELGIRPLPTELP